MLEDLHDASRRVVGAKQLLRALDEGRIVMAFVATDADKFVTKPVEDRCLDRNIPCRAVPTMSELGKACGIDVGAAAAGVARR
jgi:large subunit ribosomal protein L7A